MSSEDQHVSDQGASPEEATSEISDKVAGMLGNSPSRRVLMTSGFGALMAGMLARPAAAAPSDIVGSPNVAIRSYQNKDDIFVLWSNGRITNAKSGETVAEPSSYTVPPGFTLPQMEQGRPKGSPQVAVDVLQDANGTYVLFADGSVKQPPTGPGDAGYGSWEFFSAHIASGQILGATPNLRVSGTRLTFRKPFRDKPFIWLFYNPGRFIMWTDYPGFVDPTESGWDATSYVAANQNGGFWGLGNH